MQIEFTTDDHGRGGNLIRVPLTARPQVKLGIERPRQTRSSNPLVPHPLTDHRQSQAKDDARINAHTGILPTTTEATRESLL